MPRFAANLSFLFQDKPFLDRFAAAAAAGFRAVEFMFPYDHPADAIGERLSATGLELALFNLPPGDWTAGDRGLAALPGQETEFRASVDLALDYARTLSATRLHCMAGLADPDDAGARKRYESALAYACDRAAEHGVTILIEPINPVDMPGYHLASFERAAEIIAKLGRKNLALQFDVYHRQIIRGDVLRGLEKLMPVIGHVQIASVPARNEPGTGELDDDRIFAALDALDYRGFVGCEYRPAGMTEDGLGWFARYRD